jgi:hypothetical protein
MPSQIFLMLALLLAFGWCWPHRAQACDGTICRDESGSMHVLVVDSLPGQERDQAIERVEDRTIGASDLRQSQPKPAKAKGKASPKTWPKAAPDSGISAETSQRLYELQLLDALRSASPR